MGNDFHLDEGDLLTLIVEVRDPDGVTVFVAWQTAKFSQDNVYNFGASWTVPKDASAGKAYEARAFILTFIEGEAMPLSAVLASKITVV